MTVSDRETLRLVPLGGLGRVGGNLLAVETESSIVVIDCGILFPRAEQPGVDSIAPCINYLLEHEHKVRGIVLTHGHEDHIGALPFVLPRLNVPLFANAFTHALIRAKLEEYPEIRPECRTFKDHEPFDVGDLRFTPIPVTHSIPQAVALAIETPVGTIIHSGDFKIDPEPVDGRHFAEDAFRAWGEKGVLALLSDSTNAMREGHTASEQSLLASLSGLIDSASEAVVVTTFASNLFRIQTVVRAAEEAGRQVLILGRKMQQNCRLGLEVGLLKAAERTFVEPENAHDYPRNKLVVLASGNQGEPTSALSRMSVGRYGSFELTPGDRVIFSSRVIPGNELAVGSLINALLRLGAEVIDATQAHIHTSGHGYQDEQRTLLELCRPEYFVPVHGELRQLMAHGKIARSTGISPSNILIVEDGQPLEFQQRLGASAVVRRTERVPVGLDYVVGKSLSGVDDDVLRERQKLATSGLVLCVATISTDGEILCPPAVYSRGVVENGRQASLLQEACDVVSAALMRLPTRVDHGKRSEEVRVALRRFFRREIDRRPFILPVITVL